MIELYCRMPAPAETGTRSTKPGRECSTHSAGAIILDDGRGAGTREDLLNLPTVGSIPTAPANCWRSTNTRTGTSAEYRFAVYATDAGMIVSKTPEGCRYDSVLDTGKQLLRVQLKRSVMINRFNHRGPLFIPYLQVQCGPKPYTADEIDVLIVYAVDRDEFLWLPHECFVGKRVVNIRCGDTRVKAKRKSIAPHYDDYVWRLPMEFGAPAPNR